MPSSNPYKRDIPRAIRKAYSKTKKSCYFKSDIASLDAKFASYLDKDIRVTLIDSDGLVFYDNSNGRNASELADKYGASNNHNTRLEVIAAIADLKHGGVAHRKSSTNTNDTYYYFAKVFYDKHSKRTITARYALKQ